MSDLESHPELGKQSTSPDSPRTSHSKDCKTTILDFDGPNDQRNPVNWSPVRKWMVAGLSILGTLILTWNGTSITIAADELNAEFGISDTDTFTNSYWVVTSWTLGGALFVLFLSILEDFGSKTGYLSFYAFFICMVIAQAVAQNFATLVITRFFSGGCVALCANTIAGMIPDLFEGAKARTLPVAFYILAYVGGSTLGPPIFAGIIPIIGNWRWIFYIQLMIYTPHFLLCLIFLPETRGHVILRREATQIRKQTGKPVYTQAELESKPAKSNIKLKTVVFRVATSIYRPIYLICTEPLLFAATLWSAVSFGTVFMFTQSVEYVFQEVYGWSPAECGYVQAAVVIGEVIGFLFTLCGGRVYLNSASHNKEMPGEPIPEARLYVSTFASFVGITGGMFIYAWTSYPSTPWIAPAIGLAMVGFGIQVVVSTIADYVTDAYAVTNYAGSAISAVASGEDIIAGILPLATQSMYTNLGIQWASTLLAFIALLLSAIPIIFIRQGRELRTRSPFMLSEGQKNIGAAEQSEEK